MKKDLDEIESYLQAILNTAMNHPAFDYKVFNDKNNDTLIDAKDADTAFSVGIALNVSSAIKLLKVISINFTDDFRQDQKEGPVAYLVKCLPSCATCEYKVFSAAELNQAIYMAKRNSEDTEDHYDVYPLWAGWPATDEQIDQWR